MLITFATRFAIFLKIAAALLLPNILAATLSSLLSSYFVFEQFRPLEQQLYAYITHINAGSFGLALTGFIAYFYPILLPSTRLETIRCRILNAPAVVALTTFAGWLTSMLISCALLFMHNMAFGGLYLVNMVLSTMSIGALAIAMSYFVQESINRRQFIPACFDNQLDGYATLIQPSIRARFLIYFSTVTLAPLAFVCWLLLWTMSTDQEALTEPQIIYIICYLLFAVLFGIGITLSFSNTFHQPLMAAMAATTRIRRGLYDTNLQVHSTDEVGMLCESINLMNSTLADNQHRITALNHEIEETQREVIFVMGVIGENRSKETGNHVRRVGEYSYLLAHYYGLPESEADLLRQVSPMHDIGKVAIPDAILNKPGRYTPEEYEVMKQHPTLGYEMLRHSQRPLLQAAAIVAYQHHEKWDGSGYPQGLKGEAIHLYGRITAVADVLDALGSERIYKRAWPDEKIFTFFREQSGYHFDPALIAILFAHLDQFLSVRDRLRDDAGEPLTDGDDQFSLALAKSIG